MKLRDHFGEDFDFSFEFFPPKTDEQEAQLWRAISELESLKPTWVSVTEGAGGSTRDRTSRVVVRIKEETNIIPVAHLTCAGVSQESLREAIVDYDAAGIENLMTLRGDPPRGETDFVAAPDGFRYAVELVQLVKELGDFCVGVAGYPEKHPEATDWDVGVRHVADKVNAGADFVCTQFFFRAADYFRLRDRLSELGADVPVIPGIMPITALASIKRMSELQGSDFPSDLAERLMAVEDDPAAVRAVGVEIATALCQDLIDGGAPGLHFYTLNRSTATREIAANLGLGA